jgi:hypothetical protein
VVGRIERRILLDHHVDPDLASDLVPAGLTLRLLDGRAVVGVCLIRLVELRPAGAPTAVGRTVEAAAHRVSVVGPGGEPGVFVPRRDTTSWAAVAVGGRLWPGVHGRARIDVASTTTALSVGVAAADGTGVAVTVDRDGRRGTTLPDADAAVAFHAVERTAWSPARRGGLEGAVMECEPWSARPVGVTAASSTWLAASLPDGGADLLGALLMEDVAVRWHPA